MNSNGRITIFVGAALIAAFTFWLGAQVDGLLFSGDGAQYLSVTEQLLAGHGLKTTTLVYPSQLAQTLPAHQTIWPPGLPGMAAALALLSGLGGDGALGLVNILSHAATAMLVMWVLYRIGVTAHFSAAIGVAYALHWEAWAYALQGLSEPFFIFFLVATAAFLVPLRSEGARAAPWLVAAALAMMGAVLVRYQAVPFAVALWIAVFLWGYARGTTLQAFATASAAVVPAFLAFAAMSVRNIAIVGSVRGGPTPPGGNSLQEQVLSISEAIYDLLGMEAGALARLCVVLSILALGTIAAASFRGRKGNPKPSDALLVYCVGGPVLNLGLAIYISAVSTNFDVSARYNLAGVPLLAIAAGVVLCAWQPATPPAEPRRPRRLVNAFGAIGLCALVVVAYENLKRQQVWFSAQPLALRVAGALQASYQGTKLSDYLGTENAPSDPILTNQAQALFILLRQPTLSPPATRFASKPWDATDIRELAARHGVQFIVLFPQIPHGKTPENDFLLQVFEANPDFAIPRLVTDTVAVFRIDGG